jgi:hypothetical protein
VAWLARIQARAGVNAYGLGVDDAILRRKDVQVACDHYIKTTSHQSFAAMAKLESALTALPAMNTLPCWSFLLCQFSPLWARTSVGRAMPLLACRYVLF